MTDDDHLVETTITSEVVFKGHLLEIRRDQVRLPNGQPANRECVVHPGAVAIIGQLPDGNLLFERQFRYPLRRVFLELPAGKIDPGEDPFQTAKRELLEETGYLAEDWRHLGVVHTAIGYSDERIEIYLARGLQMTDGQALDPGEFLEIVSISLDQACEKVLSGEISDGKTICALFWAERYLR